MKVGARDLVVLAAGAVRGTGEGGFAGRAAELAAIARCRVGAVAGTPWVVVIEGEAGIGKTALARQALQPGADGLRVCWAQADHAEQDYPYGVVEQLLRRLPPDTAGARKLVRALTPSASPLTVGADMLSVLAAACDGGPLAVVVDDAPWADGASLKALAFVLRRLFAEPLLTVITARTEDGPATGPPDVTANSNPGAGTQPELQWRDVTRGTAHLLQLRVGSLGLKEVAELTTATGVDRLGPAALERLHERTSGHPLHLRSLLTQVSPEALADLARPLPVPTTLEAVIRQNLGGLPTMPAG